MKTGDLMNKETAEGLFDGLQRCVHELEESLRFAMKNCNDDEVSAYRRGVAYVMSEIQDRLLDPICREHADVIPTSETYTPRTGSTLAELGKLKR